MQKRRLSTHRSSSCVQRAPHPGRSWEAGRRVSPSERRGFVPSGTPGDQRTGTSCPSCPTEPPSATTGKQKQRAVGCGFLEPHTKQPYIFLSPFPFSFHRIKAFMVMIHQHPERLDLGLKNIYSKKKKNGGTRKPCPLPSPVLPSTSKTALCRGPLFILCLTSI